MAEDRADVAPPAPDSEWNGVGPYGEHEWVKVTRIDPHDRYGQVVVYEVLEGSEEGRTMTMPVHQWRENFTEDL